MLGNNSRKRQCAANKVCDFTGSGTEGLEKI